MKITVLGSASGISMPGRCHASVALETGDGLYILDLGEPVGREMLSRRLPVERLKAAFITHMHSDHAGGLFQLIKNLHLYHNHPDYLPQVDEITIGLPAEATDAVKRFLAASYMFPERLNVRVQLLAISSGTVYEDRNVRVLAHPTTHLENYRSFIAAHPEYAGCRCEAFSLEVAAEGKRILYSGDVGGISDITGVAGGADMLILEFGHLLPLEENLRDLADIGIGRIILTHIFPDYTDRTAQLQAVADSVLPGRVVVAEDGLEVSV